MRFDAHTHLFDSRVPLRGRRRYAPSYEASPTALLRHLDDHDIAGALLVQTSFAATPDPLFATAQEYEGRFRVVVAPADIDELEAHWDEWVARGAVGVRLNLLGRELPPLASPRWRAAGERMAEAGVHLEVHAEGAQWGELNESLLDWPADLVIDHLGRPRAAGDLGPLAGAERTWFKVSGPYRWPDEGAARMLLDDVIERTGGERLLWGSDWPHTQHESEVDYDAMVCFAQEGLPDVVARAADANLQRLLGARAFPAGAVGSTETTE